MNMKQKERILFNSRKTPNDILGNIRINAKQNNILYKIRGNKFVSFYPGCVYHLLFL